MYFGFVGAERFDDGHFKEEVVFGNCCFQEGVGFGKRWRCIEDFMWSSLLMRDFEQE